MALTLVATYPAGGAMDPTVTAPSSKPVANAEGNLLVLVGAWDTSFAAGAAQPVPASSVCDSQGNWWRLAGDSGSACPAARVAVWVCQNPLAIPATGWVSFALQGYVAAGLWTVAEFSGLPAGYVPAFDFAVAADTGSGTAPSLSLSALAGQADYCFAACAATGISTSITAPPGAPWTTLASGGNVTPLETLNASCSYATAASGVTLTPSWTFSGASAAAAVMVGISQASFPPAQPNPDFPAVKTEMAFGANAGDPSAAVPDAAWTDVTARTLAGAQVAGISYARGRQYELSTPESGTLTVAMNNLDGAFNPSWPGSPYYSSALNPNPSVQTTTAPWTPYDGAAVSLSTAFTYASAAGATAQYSMLLTPDGATGYPGCYSDAFTPVSVNDAYVMSFWVYCPAGWASGAVATIHWYDSGYGSLLNQQGSVFPVPAGEWLNVTLPGAAPPAGAAYAQPGCQFQGTPPSSTLFYIAEPMLSTGTAPRTGAVKLGTPVRVSAFWQGRVYPVAYGLTERLPQDWPDLPQWGFSSLVATDQAGAAASVTLPSAVQGEILADAPYACLPFNDQYSTADSTLNGPVKSPASCAGLAAVNTSRVNQQAGTYAGPVTAGQSLTLAGDSGTAMGVSSYSAVDTSGARGGGAVYGPDAGLPAITASSGSTWEYWVSVPSGPSNPPSGTQYFAQLQLFTHPNIASALSQHMPGWLLTVQMAVPPVSGGPSLVVSQSSASVSTTAGAFSYDTAHHVVVTIDANGVTSVYLDTSETLLAAALPLYPVTAAAFGGAPYSYGNAYDNWNYAIAYGTVYPCVLPFSRIEAHYASGSAGFAGDPLAQRFARYLAWGGAGLMPGGPGQVPDAMLLAAAYGTDGTSLASALSADAQSSGGTWYAAAGGNLVVLPRPALYNQPASVTFGDDPAAGEVPYKPDLGFDYDNTYLANVVQATLAQGPNTSAAPVEKDPGSIGAYGTRGPLSLSVSGTTAEDAYDAASWALNAYAQPHMRVRQLTADPASYPAAFAAVLQTEIADTATVNRRPVGGAPYSLPVIVQRVEGSVGPGTWTVTYQMSPYAQQGAVLTADAAGSDVLGGNSLAW